ncbi:hypothetical protein FPV67DRAFT_1531959 [Lyophyllum atratum]|nr:hypothetical protein FPV67DRAFT_1531959 [Lyophyllum atratum]
MSKTTIPSIAWQSNNGELIWNLITELEKPENFKVFCGKKDKDENTSGDSKAKASKRMAEVILPDYFKINGRTVGDRVKGKIDALITEYRKHAKRLTKTGEGIGGPDSQSDDTPASFFIEGGGPNEETPAHALNIWDEIVRVWPYFPRMHALFGSRPNVTPIAVTTGVGPNGLQTQWFQRPDDFIDPVLLNTPERPVASAPTQPLTATRSFGSEHTNYEPGTPTPSQVSRSQVSGSLLPRYAKPSSASRDAIERLKASNSTVPKKRSAIDQLLELSKENIQFMRDSSERKQVSSERSQLFEEYKAGLWTDVEFRAKVDELTRSKSPPAKRRREYSPDWDLGRFDDDEGEQD